MAAIENPDRRMWAVQYHPEVAHTPHGQRIIERFVHSLAGCANTWTMANIIDEATSAIAAQIGAGRAICGLSGGVDSAVAAALVSAREDVAIPAETVIFGEISLSGALRPVGQTENRLKEASILGFSQATVPSHSKIEGAARLQVRQMADLTACVGEMFGAG